MKVYEFYSVKSEICIKGIFSSCAEIEGFGAAWTVARSIRARV